MKKLLTAALLIAASIVNGCSENSTAPQAEEKVYYPVTEGSSWTYEQVDPKNTYSFTRRISGNSVFNGKQYVRAITTMDKFSDTTYFRRSADTLFGLRKSTGIANEEIGFVERKGATWSIVMGDSEFTATENYTVMDDGLTRTVAGKTYTDVMYVKGDAVFETATTRETTSIEAYLAKGIGIIELSTSEGTVTRLKSYTIK